MTAPHKFNTPEALERYQSMLEAADRIVEFLEQEKRDGVVVDYELSDVTEAGVYLYVYVPREVYWNREQRGELREAIRSQVEESVYVQAMIQSAA